MLFHNLYFFSNLSIVYMLVILLHFVAFSWPNQASKMVAR